MELKVFLVAAGFFLFLGAVTGQSGKITASPPGGGYLVGTAVDLTCSFDDGSTFSSMPDAKWVKDSTQVNHGGNIGIEPQGRILRIKVAAATDSGEYTCTPSGKGTSDKFKVVVEAPKKPKLTCPSGKVGETTTCKCVSTNDALLKPIRYDFTVDGTNRPKDEVKVTGKKDLNGKEVACKVVLTTDDAGVSAAGTAKMTFESGTTAVQCSGVSLMTIGFVLLLSTLLV